VCQVSPRTLIYTCSGEPDIFTGVPNPHGTSNRQRIFQETPPKLTVPKSLAKFSQSDQHNAKGEFSNEIS